MPKGRRYELETKNRINECTRRCVKAHRPDFSGNSKGEVADVMVVWQDDVAETRTRKVVYLELKNKDGVPSGGRKVMMNGSSKGQSGKEELLELRKGSPLWTEQYVVFNFQNRAPIVLDAGKLYDHLVYEQPYRAAQKHEMRLTRGNNISVVKPELEYWDSAKAGASNHVEILRGIGLDDYYITINDNNGE